MKFGENLTLEIYGASHSERLDVILKNIPSGHIIDREKILEFMARRAPGNDPYSTPRKEKDEPIVTSGIENGMTTGDDIKAYIQNTNRHSSDYSSIRHTPRPGHADYAAYLKYGPDSPIMLCRRCVLAVTCRAWREHFRKACNDRRRVG